MKRAAKTILALAAGLTVLASCNKNPDYHSGREIVFGISGVRVETRSPVETDIDELRDNGFRVICGTTPDEPLMFNATVRYDSSDRVFRNPSTRYYYPENGSQLSFGAVYPPTETIQMDDGIGIIHYTQNPDEDLCAAYQTDVQESTIMMDFSHKLAQITINCASDDESVDCKVDDIAIIAKNKADLCIDLFACDIYWEGDEDAEDTEYPIVSEETAVSTTMTPVGETMTFIPGNYTLKVRWSIYRKGTNELLAQYSNSITGLNVSFGIHKTFNLTLPNCLKDINFASTVQGWTEKKADIAPAAEKGTFTVNRTGKKVRFAPGNLYWDGSKFAFEAHQYDLPASWNTGHVGHFHWSDDAATAVARNFSGTVGAGSDRFFAVDGGAVEGYTVLSKEEWTYVLSQHLAVISEPTEDNAYAFTIAGVKCIILTPDFFAGTLKDQYTATEWAAAESSYGLVALPFAGYRNGPSMSISGNTGHYWTCSAFDGNAGESWKLDFNPSCVYTYSARRDSGYSVRLVSIL